MDSEQCSSNTASWVHYSSLIMPTTRVRPGNLDGCCEKHYSDQHIYGVKFAWFYIATKPSNHRLFNKSTKNDKFQGYYSWTRKKFNSWSVYTSRHRPSLYMASISVSGDLITSAYNRIITSDNSVYTTDAMLSHALPPNVVWVIQTHVLKGSNTRCTVTGWKVN